MLIGKFTYIQSNHVFHWTHYVSMFYGYKITVYTSVIVAITDYMKNIISILYFDRLNSQWTMEN